MISIDTDDLYNTYKLNVNKNISLCPSEKSRFNNKIVENFGVNNLCNKNSNFHKLALKAWKSTFPDKPFPINIELRKGNPRAKHHDMVLELPNGEVMKCELKFSKSDKKILQTDRPWKIGVQFLNTSCKKYSLCRDYAILFYESLPKIKEELSIDASIPDFETWYNDINKQDKTTTDFTIELRNKYEDKYTKQYLSNLRIENVEKFNLSEEQLETFRQEAETIINDALQDKDCWIAFSGCNLSDVNDTNWTPYDLKIYGKMDIVRIVKATQITKYVDTQIDLLLNDGSNLRAHIRWGYKQYVGNLRIDFK